MKKLLAFTLILLIALSSVASFAAEFPTTGFYVNNSVEGENVYFDVYTFLNNKKICLNEINEAGIENVIFIQQSGDGIILGDMLGDFSFKNIKDLNFDAEYKDIISGTKINTGFILFKVIEIY